MKHKTLHSIKEVLRHTTGGCTCSNTCIYWQSIEKDGEVNYQKLQALALAQIQDLIMGALPDRKDENPNPETGAPQGEQGFVNYGYNQAIKNTKTNLSKVMGGKHNA